MNLLRILLLLILSCTITSLKAQEKASVENLKLWYTRPAIAWEEALPLGNGKTGAMVFGKVQTERIQLNDNTLWSGSPLAGNVQEGPEILKRVREQIFLQNYDSAASVWKEMTGPYSARYLPLADLWLKFNYDDSVGTNYYRELDLNTATSTVHFTVNNTRFTRTTFISYPAKVLVMQIKADKKGSVAFALSLSSKLKNRISISKSNILSLIGKAPKYVAHRAFEPQQIVYDDWNGEGTNFEVQAKVEMDGKGRIEKKGEQLFISDADAVTIYLSSATSFNGFDKSPGLQGKDPHKEVTGIINTATRQSFDQLAKSHIKDYQALFKRVSLKIPSASTNMTLPTDERLKGFKEWADDFGLQTLYYQFGRYLMIASSRKTSIPTNLQGLWNDKVQPPWGSNYTININTQMNYWPAENTNLSECHYPLINFIQDLSINGAVTAKELYGIKEGWVAHHNSDIWAKTSPAGGMGWKDPVANARFLCWPMAGGWMGTHLWEHYLYTGNKQFLKDTAYPLMKGAALFLKSWLIKDPASGYWVTNPSTSPENTAKHGGKEYDITMASTMDMSIIKEIFSDYIKAAKILNMDAALVSQLGKMEKELYPYYIGQYGQLQEWFKDWDDPKDKHRHLSHLFGLYPGSQVTIQQTAELAAAAKRSLLFRGDVSTGWSMAWKINWWARLRDGAHAYKILKDAFTFIDPNTQSQTGGGGAYPNLFDACPPFQIDGNFGATAGITEMLMQSHEGYIFLLPALPPEWKEGTIRGIKARGNFQLDIDWRNGMLQRSVIYSKSGGICRIRAQVPVKVLETPFVNTTGKNAAGTFLTGYGHVTFINNAKEPLEPVNKEPGYIIEFKTEKGKQYTVVPLPQ